MKIQKESWLAILVIVLFICVELWQYKDQSVSAVTVGTPNPGHVWSSMECSADSLCVDTANNRLGIGTNNPTTKLDVNGVINVNSNKITNVALPTSDADAATKAYVDASSGSSCPANYGNLCTNGGGLAFSYSGKTLYIDATPRSAIYAISTSGGVGPVGQAYAWQQCQNIGARLVTLAEWQAACAALGGPSGNGLTTFGGGHTRRYEWTATTSSATDQGGSYLVIIAGGGSCTGTLEQSTGDQTNHLIGNGGYGDYWYWGGGSWFRCIR